MSLIDKIKNTGKNLAVASGLAASVFLYNGCETMNDADVAGIALGVLAGAPQSGTETAQQALARQMLMGGASQYASEAGRRQHELRTAREGRTQVNVYTQGNQSRGSNNQRNKDTPKKIHYIMQLVNLDTGEKINLSAFGGGDYLSTMVINNLFPKKGYLANRIDDNGIILKTTFISLEDNPLEKKDMEKKVDYMWILENGRPKKGIPKSQIRNK